MGSPVDPTRLNDIIVSDSGAPLTTYAFPGQLAGCFDLVLKLAANTSLSLPATGALRSSPVANGVVLATTIDQTSTSETAHLTLPIASNVLIAGTAFRIVAWGTMDNPAVATTFTPRMRWGGITGNQLTSTPTAVTTTTANSNKAWRFEGLVIVRAIGATGKVVSDAALEQHIVSSTGAWQRDQDCANVEVTVDTTTPKDLVFSWQIALGLGTAHVRTVGGFIEPLVT